MDLREVLDRLNEIYRHVKYGELYDIDQEISDLIADVMFAIAEEDQA